MPHGSPLAVLIVMSAPRCTTRFVAASRCCRTYRLLRARKSSYYVCFKGEFMDEENPLPAELDLQAIAAASTVPLPPDRDIDVSYFSHKSRKSTRLVGNLSPSDAMRSRREWLSFDLKEPIYITSIKVFATGYGEHHEMELSAIDALSNEETSDKRSFGDKEFSFEPKRFLKGFGLRPDSSIFETPYLTKIEVKGLELKYFSEVVKIYDNIQRERKLVEENLDAHLERARLAESNYELKKAKLSEQDVVIQENEEQIEELNSTIVDLGNQRDEMLKKIEVNATIERERSDRLQGIDIEIGNLNERRRNISSEIEKKDTQLRSLKNNIDLFPTEIAGYVGQGTSNIRLYFWVSFIPMAIVAAVSYRLFSNAEKLLSFDVSSSASNIATYLLSRAPYVVVSAAILGICYSLIKGLVSEIININRRRQELYKISIIATDVSYASQSDLDLDDEQRYDLRTQTKMEMLKEHLKMNIGDDFSYSPKSEYLRTLGSALKERVGQKSAAPATSTGGES